MTILDPNGRAVRNAFVTPQWLIDAMAERALNDVAEQRAAIILTDDMGREMPRPHPRVGDRITVKMPVRYQRGA